MSYLSLTDRDREQMLAAIGVASVEDLFREIPRESQLQRPLDLEPPLSEPELVAHLEELASRNVDTARAPSSEQGSTTTTCRPRSTRSSSAASC